MNTSAGLTGQNVSVGGGQASLSWLPQSMLWTGGSEFVGANGTVDSNVSAGASGLSLAANWSNRLRDANFTSAAPWSFINGTSDNVTAEWDRAFHNARLAYEAPSTVRVWDG
ncbi:MAG TPA: hypothetical protein VEY12_06875, partial [Thermoplasmata archaeon]|nr:hypothetical protein [Thermoplasmata archaeon]